MPNTHYKQITIVSGKGGTGKTTLAASFGVLARDKVLVDADVDAANLHLLLHPELQETYEFPGAKAAVRDEERCRQAGECERLCRFDAITRERVNVFACEGCGLCVLACPNQALRLEPYVCGEYYVGVTPYGPLVHAHLRPGAENSGRLVTVVRQKAEDIALAEGLGLILIDGPPGIGCSATAAIADVDLLLMVTEPTLAAMHDLERIVRLAKHFGIPACVFINKWDLSAENTAQLEVACSQWGLPIVGRLAYAEAVAEAVAQGRPLVEYDPGGLGKPVEEAWERLREGVFAAS